MLAALASAALIAAGSLAIGQAILFGCGSREWTWLAAPVGLATLLCASAIAAGFDAHGSVIAIVDVALLVAATGYLGGRGGDRHGGPSPALISALLAGLAAAIPFIAAGAVGILGVGLVNDDMANHLLLADWIGERFRPEPVLIDQGYPLGPHALVAGLSSLLGASSIDVFAGLTLAIPALTALIAYAALDGLRPAARVPAAALVSLPYLAAAYLAQEAFKEPLVALFLLGFALLLPKLEGWRTAIPLGVLAAGTVYVYSFPGLAWLAGAAIVWAIVGRRGWRDLAPPAAAALIALAVLSLPEVGRLLDFADFRALHPDRANEGGLGNLPSQLSPLEALGIWPTSEFRLSAGDNSLPAVVFYAGALAAAVGLALAAGRWVRVHGSAIPAALLAAALLYLAARAFGTVYTSAKALAIASPLVLLIALGGLLASPQRALRWLALGLGLAAAASSFLILRQAPVGPEAHMDELAEIRPLVEGEKLLYLGRDNFISHELRGSKPFTAVKNFYDPFYVKPNTELGDVFAKFDFDSVDARTLAKFPYVLTTRAAYASGPPPGYRVVTQTPSYVLWKRGGGVPDRFPAERDAAPGRILECEPGTVSVGETASFAEPPVVGEWSADTVEAGAEAIATLELPRGDWQLSLQYDATREVTVSADGETVAELPANLDYRGPAPFWPAGELETTTSTTEVAITATVGDPPLAGRLLGADSVLHLGTVAASPAGQGYVRGGEEPLPGTGERLGPAAEACGEYADWVGDGR